MDDTTSPTGPRWPLPTVGFVLVVLSVLSASFAVIAHRDPWRFAAVTAVGGTLIAYIGLMLIMMWPPLADRLGLPAFAPRDEREHKGERDAAMAGFVAALAVSMAMFLVTFRTEMMLPTGAGMVAWLVARWVSYHYR